MTSTLTVRIGETKRHAVTLDGYPSGAVSVAFTLPDGSSWAPGAGVSPVHAAVNVDAINNDRVTLTLAGLGVSGNAVARGAGDVWVLLDGAAYQRRLQFADGALAVLTEPLPGTAVPDSISWARHTFTTDPAADGPGSVVGTLEGVLTYSIYEDGGTAEKKRALALDTLAREFWTGLTVHVLHRRTAGIAADAGGNTAETESRYGDHQGVIEDTLERLANRVRYKVRSAARLDTVVTGQRFLTPHILMVRAELATDPTRRAQLLEEVEEQIDVIIDLLPVDTDDDGVVDGEVSAGYVRPTSLSAGFPTSRTFKRGMTR